MWNFFDDFWVYLGEDSFSQKNSKIGRNKKHLSFNVVKKLELKVKNWCIDTHVDASKIISFFYLFLKPLKISFKFTFASALNRILQ